MEFKIRKEKLMYALNNVTHAVSSKSTVALLKGVYISAKDNKLELRGTDMDMFIQTDIECEVLSEGEIVVGADIFLEMIKRMPDDILHLYTDGENKMLSIKCKKIELNVVYNDGVDYPKLPNIIKDINVTIPQKLIRDMVKATSFAVGVDETRPILQGILFEIKNKKLSLVALDGYRMAIRSETVDVDIEMDISVVIMGKNFLEVAKMLDSKENVTVSFTQNQILFELGKTKVVSRLLEGKYVEYNALLPRENNINIKLKKSELESAIERASLVGKSEKGNVIKIELSEDKIYITSNSNMGKVKEEVDAEVKGECIKMAFNPRFVLDVLKNIEDEEIVLNLRDSLSPCLITNESSKYLVLPVRMAS